MLIMPVTCMVPLGFTFSTFSSVRSKMSLGLVATSAVKIRAGSGRKNMISAS